MRTQHSNEEIASAAIEHISNYREKTVAWRRETHESRVARGRDVGTFDPDVVDGFVPTWSVVNAVRDAFDDDRHNEVESARVARVLNRLAEQGQIVKVPRSYGRRSVSYWATVEEYERHEGIMETRRAEREAARRTDEEVKRTLVMAGADVGVEVGFHADRVTLTRDEFVALVDEIRRAREFLNA